MKTRHQLRHCKGEAFRTRWAGGASPRHHGASQQPPPQQQGQGKVMLAGTHGLQTYETTTLPPCVPSSSPRGESMSRIPSTWASLFRPSSSSDLRTMISIWRQRGRRCGGLVGMRREGGFSHPGPRIHAQDHAHRFNAPAARAGVGAETLQQSAAHGAGTPPRHLMEHSDLHTSAFAPVPPGR